MDSSQPNTSNDETFLLDESSSFDKGAYTFLKNVLQELVLEDTEMQSTESKYIDGNFIQRAQRYTGLHACTIQKLADEEDIVVEKLEEIDRKSIHDKLLSIYLEEKKIPTSTELFNSLQSTLPIYEDIRSFRKKLVKMGYIFKKIGLNFVVCELPSIRFQRFLYLKSIIQYRTENRNIYYISEVEISHSKVLSTDKSNSEKVYQQHRFLFAVSSLNGVQFLKKVSDFDKTNFNSWLFYNVIPYLDTHSVIILNNSKHHCDTYCETPEKSSPRFEIIDWLKFHHIPFSETMNRVELYTLAEKCTDLHTSLYKPDIWLKRNGHNVLRLPNCIHEMTPAAQVRQFVINNVETKKELLLKDHEDMMKEISEKKLVDCNLILIEEEKRLFDLEIKLDGILDQLECACDVEIDLNLPHLSDSD